MEPRLVDRPRERDRARRVVEGDVEVMGRQVGDPPVERMPQPPVLVEVGSTVAHQSAAGHELIEAVEPPEP